MFKMFYNRVFKNNSYDEQITHRGVDMKTKCCSCEKEFDGDVIVIMGDCYCYDCAAICDGCGKELWVDSIFVKGEQDYCESCFEQQLIQSERSSSYEKNQYSTV